MEIEQIKAFAMKCPACNGCGILDPRKGICGRCGGTGKVWIALRPEEEGIRALEVFLVKDGGSEIFSFVDEELRILPTCKQFEEWDG